MELNTYTYEVHTNKNLHLPLHIVEFHSNYACGVCVFSNAKEAKNYIFEIGKRDGQALTYDYNATINGTILNAYKNAKSLFSKIDGKQIYIAY